jgi:hypothetical protein
MSFPFETMTAQEVFDKVAKHLLTQAKPSLLGSGKCAYRGRDGSMCAAGCLIPDDKYYSGMEDLAWDELVEKGFIPQHPQRGLILKLQSVHDAYFPISWKTELKKLAFDFGLEFKFDAFGLGEQ